MQTIYTEKKTASLKRDENQPRTNFDPEDIKGMAKSIKVDGLINAIEIDENDVIVTGERRWRAATLAGVKTVPVKILKGLGEKDRFRRQLVENIHTNTLGDWEKAIALGKLIGMEPGDKIVEEHEGKIKEVSELIGKNKTFVREHVEMLTLLPDLREELKNNRLQRTITRAVNLIPEKLREMFQKKIIKEKLPRDGAVFLATKVNLYPEITSELLEKDYSGLDSMRMRKEIEKIAPDPSEIMKGFEKKNKEIDELISDVFDWLSKNHPERLPRIYKRMVQVNLSFLAAGMKKWATGGSIEKPPLIALPDKEEKDKK